MTQQINLYQVNFREDKQRFSANTLLQSALAVAATLLAIGAYQGWQILHLNRQVTSLERQVRLVKQQSADLTQKLVSGHEDPALAAKVQQAERLLKDRQQLQTLLTDDLFNGEQGYSGYLVALARQHIAGLWLTGITLTGAGRDLILRGETYLPDLVPRYLQRLSGEARLQGLEFQVFQLNRDTDKSKAANQGRFAFLVATSEEKTEDQP